MWVCACLKKNQDSWLIHTFLNALYSIWATAEHNHKCPRTGHRVSGHLTLPVFVMPTIKLAYFFLLYLPFSPVPGVRLLWHVRQDPAIPPRLKRWEHPAEADCSWRHPWRRPHWGGAFWYAKQSDVISHLTVNVFVQCMHIFHPLI